MTRRFCLEWCGAKTLADIQRNKNPQLDFLIHLSLLLLYGYHKIGGWAGATEWLSIPSPIILA